MSKSTKTASSPLPTSTSGTGKISILKFRSNIGTASGERKGKGFKARIKTEAKNDLQNAENYIALPNHPPVTVKLETSKTLFTN